MTRFENRAEAGSVLARELLKGPGLGARPLVLGLVRGGAQVAASLGEDAGVPWDVFVVRKIGAPQQPEYALGALAETGRYLLNQNVISQLQLGERWVSGALATAGQQCRALAEQLRGSPEPPAMEGRDVIITDDGVATGFTMRVAVAAVEAYGAASVLVAVPVIAPDTLTGFKRDGINCFYLDAPHGFHAVGQYYRDFSQVTSRDVQQLLAARQS